MDWLDLLAVQGTLKSLLQHHSSKASIFRHSGSFTVQLSHPHMTNGKTIALTRQTFVVKVMSLLFNMLSRFVITFFSRSKRLLISWLQSPSAVILEPKKIKSNTLAKYAQNSSNQTSTVCEPWTSRCSSWIWKRQRNWRSNWQHPLDNQKRKSSKKTSTSALWTMPKPLTVWTTTSCGKFFKRWEYQTSWPDSWEICMQVKKQQLKMDKEQQTGSK